MAIKISSPEEAHYKTLKLNKGIQKSTIFSALCFFKTIVYIRRDQVDGLKCVLSRVFDLSPYGYKRSDKMLLTD